MTASAPRSQVGTTVLAFDFGTRRVGVAVGEPEVGVAHPLAVIPVSSNERLFGEIARLVAEWQPGLLVVGLPRHMDGTEHALGTAVRRFARRLEGRFGLRCELVDERLSSAEAESRLRELGTSLPKAKAVVDSVAAREILQDWLDTHGAA